MSLHYKLVSIDSTFISDSLGEKINRKHNWSFSRVFPEELYQKNWWRKFCGKNITRNYIRIALQDWGDNIILVYSLSTGDMIGFASIWIERNYIYLNLICTLRGYGKTVLNDIEHLAKHTLRKKYIKLSAIPYVINYYRRLGYIHIDRCPYAKHLVKQTEGKAQSLQHLRFQNDKEALRHKQFAQFLKYLTKKGMGNQTDGFTMVKCI